VYKLIAAAVLLITVTTGPKYQLGHEATPEEIRAADISVFPDGTGLPRGSGTARTGAAIYGTKCVACHGANGKGNADFPRLSGGIGTLTGPEPILTVGSYWPYATTVWDYVHRAMPYTRPGTLNPDEVYALTAYILALNGIISDTTDLNQRSLPAVRMPNRDGFIADSRPDTKGSPPRQTRSRR
jgi:hypothetical protein